MKKINILLFVLFLPLYIYAQDAKFEALFVYNFTRQIEWPQAYKQGNFFIKVLGESPIYSELKELTRERKAGSGNQDFVIEQISDLSKLGTCHVLFIPATKSVFLREAIRIVGNNSTLIITEQEGLTSEGSGISLMKNGNILQYQYNIAHIERNGLKVDAGFRQIGIAK